MLHAIDRFTLAQHAGPYESWPLTTPLHVDGAPTGARISGFVIEAQYRAGDRYLIATSWDCPFEEMQTFTLLSSEYAVLSERNYGAPYASVWLESHAPRGDDAVVFSCDDGNDVIITIRRRRPLGIFPLLRMDVVARARRPK